jgi:hypothetical protein
MELGRLTLAVTPLVSVPFAALPTRAQTAGGCGGRLVRAAMGAARSGIEECGGPAIEMTWPEQVESIHQEPAASVC